MKYTNQIIKYQEPTVLNARHQMLRIVDKTDNYSENGQLSILIIRSTYNFSLRSTTEIKQYKNIDQLQNERSNITELTQEEIQYMEKQKLNNERESQRREENQRMMDRLYSQQHDKLHNIMISQR